MTRDEAETILGFELGDTVSAVTVTSNFAYQLKAAHPDQGGDPAAAPERIRQLKEAKALLLRWLEGDDITSTECRACRGKGRRRAGLGTTSECPTCEGTGRVPMRERRTDRVRRRSFRS